jgi:hypothetical protein
VHADTPRCFGTSSCWHANVDEGKVRLLSCGAFDGLGCVGCGGSELELTVSGDQCRQCIDHRRIVIRDEDTDWPVASHLTAVV